MLSFYERCQVVVEHVRQSVELTPSIVTIIVDPPSIIVETDGCFIPIVETGAGIIKGGRKKRDINYREVRLSLAHAHESKTMY